VRNLCIIVAAGPWTIAMVVVAPGTPVHNESAHAKSQRLDKKRLTECSSELSKEIEEDHSAASSRYSKYLQRRENLSSCKFSLLCKNFDPTYHLQV
jgi:hypothetical protein